MNIKNMEEMNKKMVVLMNRINATIAKGEDIISRTKNASERNRWNRNLAFLLSVEDRIKATMRNVDEEAEVMATMMRMASLIYE